MISLRKNPGSKSRSASERPRSMKTQQYYKGQSPMQPSGLPKKPKGWFLYLTLLCLFVLFFYNLIIDPKANVSVNSDVYRPKHSYQQKLVNLLSSPLNRNKLTIDTKDIQQQFKDEFPEVSFLTFNIPLIGQTANVDIKVADPAIVLSSGNDKYIVDGQGRAVVKNPTQDSSSLLKLNDQTGFEAKLGQQVLTTEEVSFIKYLHQQAKSKNINIKEFVLPASTPAELYMYLADKPYFVKFYMGGDADVQLGSYLAVEKDISSSPQAPSQYIDVRVEERVFVK